MIHVDIPMPEHCYDCPCHDGESGFCQITGKYYYDEIPRSCPLVELPSVQPEPCEDAVSRNEVFNVIEDVAYDVDAGVDSWYGLMNDKVRTLPSVQPEQKKGYWEYIERREPRWDIHGVKTWGVAYKCSECGFIHMLFEDFGIYEFCPSCGCDMRGKQE